jgi:hypothetical protein
MARSNRSCRSAVLNLTSRSDLLIQTPDPPPTTAQAAKSSALSRVEWGTAGDWVTGIVTVPLIIIALVSMKRERRRNDRLQSINESLLNSQRQEHAGQIAAWPSSLTSTGTLLVKCVNTSDRPAYDLEVMLVTGHARKRVGSLLVFPPKFEESIELTVEGSTGGSLPVCIIEFTDSSGLRWRRTSDGILETISRRSG